MKIEVVLTEAEIVQELAEAVEGRDLSEKFFYWSPMAVRAWLALAAEAPFHDVRQCWKQLATRSAWLLEPFSGPVPVISLGAGDGSTDRLLLDPVRQSGREQKYYPVDASQALLEMACAGGEDLDIETSGIKADISSPMHLVFASDAAESPKLLVMAGNTLGGFDPVDHVRQVAKCLHSGDRLVLDAEIYQGNETAPHESDAMRHFTFAPLAGLCVSGEEGEVLLEHKRDERLAGLYVTRAYFRPNRDLRIPVAGQDVLLQRAERIVMNLRYSLTTQAFRLLLEQQGGLKILDEIASPSGQHLLAVCSRR
jgi:hypothetical protein